MKKIKQKEFYKKLQYQMNSRNPLSEANILLCDILREYCGGMEDNPEYYETERNSEARAVMFLSKQGIVELIDGEWPTTRIIKFKFVGE